MEVSSTISMALFLSLTIALGVLWMCDATVQVDRPRGVSLSNEPVYNKDAHGEWFTCLDGSLKIPRSQLNDDYCDCPDFSDEPGTSACPEGRFHCNNRGYRPIYIPSSRVNDGICDCCDASDEYEGPRAGLCVNNCKELGKKDLEERRQQIVLSNQGFDIRLGYIKEGQAKKAERGEALIKLQAEREEAQVIMDAKQKVKDDAEGPETEAKDKHKAAWEAEVAAKKAADDKVKALQAFKELDIDSNGHIFYHELRSRTEFDADNSGDVTDEEAMNVLGGLNLVDEAAFVENVWDNIRDQFKFAYQLAAEQAAAEAAQQQEGQGTEEPGNEPAAFDDFADEDEDDEDFEDDLEEEDEWADDDDEDVDDEDDIDVDMAEEMRRSNRERRLNRQAKRQERLKNRTNDKTPLEDDMPDYDEETKALIATADQARLDFDDAEKRLKDADRSIGDIEKQLKVDLGPEQEFQPLQGQCYEFTDREYLYKLCPFEKSSQRPKNGGTETSLGSWNQWEGPPENKYSVMMYTRGQKCWNGPDRSTRVILKCGIENKILSASEPDRCVYQFEFTTPALCSYKYDLSTGEAETHDEL